MTVDVGDTVALTGTASDPEGESMTYAWTSDIGGLFSAPIVPCQATGPRPASQSPQ